MRQARAATGSGPEPARELPPPLVIIATTMLTGVLAPLNSTMIVVALPEILADLDASLTWGSWIVISYLVAMAAVQPLGGALGDRFGRRRLLLLGLAGFLAASIVAALAPTVQVLVAARTVQAITGATAIPNGTALLRTLLPTEVQGKAFGVVGAGIGVAAAWGPPLGGLITGAFDWRWIFLVNLLVLGPALVLAHRLPPSDVAGGSERFDLTGAGLLLTTLVSIALAGTVWRAEGAGVALPVALAGLATVAAVTLRRHASRIAAPVVDLALFARRGYLPAGLTVATSNLTMYTIFLALPVFTTQLAGWGARDVGLLIAGMSVPMMVFGPVGGALADRYGRRAPAVVGTLVTVVGVVPLAFVDAAWTWPQLLAPLLVVGTGIGLSSAPVHAAAMHAARSGEAGQAAGLFSTMRYAGSIVGTAGMAAVLGDAAGPGPFRALFGLLVVAALAAAASAARLPPAADERSVD